MEKTVSGAGSVPDGEGTLMEVMVFDVGGTEIKYSVLNDHLRFRDGGSVPTPMDTLDTFLDTLEELYRPHSAEVAGIAVSLPGFIDTERGVVLGGGALHYNWKQPVGPMLAERTGCTVRLANDAKCAALAELEAGELRGVQNGCAYVIGTGIGGGLVIGGEVVNGIHGTAGEFSFLQTEASRPQDIFTMMSWQCGTPSLLRRYRERKGLPDSVPLDGREFFRRYHDGDAEAEAAFEDFCAAVSVQLYNLSMALDLEKIAVGGGISRQKALIDGLRRHTAAQYHALVDVPSAGYLKPPTIAACRFTSEANQVGALFQFLRTRDD